MTTSREMSLGVQVSIVCEVGTVGTVTPQNVTSTIWRQKVVTFCVKKLLHFGLILHFASIATFCGVTGTRLVVKLVKFFVRCFCSPYFLFVGLDPEHNTKSIEMHVNN